MSVGGSLYDSPQLAMHCVDLSNMKCSALSLCEMLSFYCKLFLV